MPDLNMYGYLYILVPLLILLLLLFLLYCCCKGTTKAPQDKQALIIDDDDDSSDLDDFGPALSAKPRSPLRSVVSNHYTSHPAMSDPRRMYTIVNMEGKPEKVPLSGGVSAMPRLYPRLSSLRKSNKKKNGMKSKTP